VRSGPLRGSSPRAPSAVRWIVRTLEAAGFETWAVGGAVRDALCGRESGDWDLTTRAHPNQVRRIFPRTIPIGIDHGTVGVLARDGTLFEVTTFRRDVETTGRHAVVSFAETLDEDLARRDFTINAVAWHPLRARFHDPFQGVRDLEEGVLRTVGNAQERFAEDYLRVLRALRFAGRFDLRVESETWQALCAAVPHMGILSPERVREELDKVLTGPGRPSASLSLYAASGAMAFLYPEFPFGTSDPDPSSERMDRWDWALRAVDLLPARPVGLRLAALLTAAGRRPEEAALASATLLTRIRASNARIRVVGGWAAAAAVIPPTGASGRELRRWLMVAGREGIRGSLRVLAARLRAQAVVLPRDEADRRLQASAQLLRDLRFEAGSGAPLTVDELALTGRDLILRGHRPGPAFGRLFRILLNEVLEDPGRNQPGYLGDRAEALLAAEPGGR
jgi:tRNA nucleotidyltransferase (CCA-adding enzyme)